MPGGGLVSHLPLTTRYVPRVSGLDIAVGVTAYQISAATKSLFDDDGARWRELPASVRRSSHERPSRPAVRKVLADASSHRALRSRSV